MAIEISIHSDSPAFRRGRELARELLLSSSKPEDLTRLFQEMVDELLQKQEASLLASVVYNLSMVAVGLRRALELEEDSQFADGIVQGLWEALAESPFPPELAHLKLADSSLAPAAAQATDGGVQSGPPGDPRPDPPIPSPPEDG